jgi:hypothetical protein
VEKIESLTVAVFEPSTATIRGSSGSAVSVQWY